MLGGWHLRFAAAAEGEQHGDDGKCAESEAPEAAEAKGTGHVGTHEGDGGDG